MLKKIFHMLDFFLPSQISDQVDIATHFRARSIVAAGLLGIIITTFLLLGTSLLEVALFVRIGIFISLIALITLIIFLKTRTEKFEFSLNLGAFLQITILFIAVYSSAFSAHGAGFFGLIWLAPLFLLIAFYFKPLYGLCFFFFNVIILSLITNHFEANFFLPIKDLGNFKSVFLLYLFLVLISSYLLSYLFIQLNGLLKEELSKQKNLLLESAKFQSLGQMASNLAHDINNPLFTIQGKLHQIRNLLSQDQLDLDKCDNIIENVEGTILRLSQIVKGISTFARQGHADQMVSVSADEIIKGIVLLGSDRIVQLGITFDIKVSPDTRVICYPSYISQVMINLLNNAIDALEHAEVKLIQVEVFTADKWIEIHVRDSGPGVDPAIEGKIFDSFFTTKKYGKGTGLGLSISRGLVEIHEGHLKYKRVGNMTDFIVCLPSYE
ncbi:MAG: GHKL domain-containing protein [Bacteriovorax sp.]|nr:GHKL domain-containing protein [Bacteriovorax sp.]